MSYPPQYPPGPQYPPAPQGYLPPQAPQYPPPAYYPPQPAQYAPPAPPPLARGSIDDFYEQPAASGKSITFKDKPPGTSYTGIVARSLTAADVQQQTDMLTRAPSTHPDGRPKFTMIIPLLVQPSAEFPDGRAAWYCKHNEKSELNRAMEAAGCKPGTPPEPGALITITYTGDRPVPGMSAQKVKQVTYQRPQGAQQDAAIVLEPAMVLEQPQAPQQYPQQSPPPQYAPQPQFTAPPQPQAAPQQFQQPQYAPPPQPQFTAPQQYQAPQYAPLPAPEPVAYQPQFQQQPAPAQPPQPAPDPQFQQPAPAQPGQQVQPPQAPASLNPDQQALLARLTGQ